MAVADAATISWSTVVDLPSGETLTGPCPADTDLPQVRFYSNRAKSALGDPAGSLTVESYNGTVYVVDFPQSYTAADAFLTAGLGYTEDEGGSSSVRGYSDFWELVDIELVSISRPRGDENVALAVIQRTENPEGNQVVCQWWGQQRPTIGPLSGTTWKGIVAQFRVHFRRRSYTVSYYGSDGTSMLIDGLPNSYVAGVSVEGDYGYGTYALPTNLWPGFSAEWYTNPEFSGSPITSFSLDKNDYGNKSFYLKLTDYPVLVVFDPAGGSWVGTGVHSNYKRLRTGSVYGSLPGASSVTRTGYVFAGWYTDGGDEVRADSVVEIMVSHVLHAHWRSTGQITVSFNPAGGEIVGGDSEKILNSGDLYGELPSASRPGYSLAGWYTAATGGDEVSASTRAGNKDVVVYAHWTGNALTITFEANGGEVSERSRTVLMGDQYRRLPVPTREGFAFDGWYTAQTGGQVVTSADYPGASCTLWAHWSQNLPIPWLVVETW